MNTNAWIASTIGCTEAESKFIDELCKNFPSATKDDDLQEDLETWLENTTFGKAKPRLANHLINGIYERAASYCTEQGLKSDLISYNVNSICSDFIYDGSVVCDEEQLDIIISHLDSPDEDSE